MLIVISGLLTILKYQQIIIIYKVSYIYANVTKLAENSVVNFP